LAARTRGSEGVTVVICSVEEFPPGSRRIVTTGGREIGVFRVDDAFYAVRNRCPHQGGPLCTGPIRHLIRANGPGEPEVDTGVPFVVCPWHGFHYNASTGEAYATGDPRVKSYPVSVEAGEILLADMDSRTPLVAETFPVYVEGRYVVLEA
jgi:nitrite reductase/ring-hydroxylating ferredoxin subunit